MRPVDRNILQRFATAFGYGRTGLTLHHILDYFAEYEASVPSLHSLEHGITKEAAFVACVSSLSPTNQRQALYDLCDDPPASHHPMPGHEIRMKLLTGLVEADGRSPVGLFFSRLTLRGIRDQWFTAASRLPATPAAAITAARALLETTCKTILEELGETPDGSGDLCRLYKQIRTRLALDPKHGASQSIHLVANGLTQCVEGVAALSNAAGDRHGLADGYKITDLSFASLCVHGAGAVAVFLTRAYKDMMRGP